MKRLLMLVTALVMLISAEAVQATVIDVFSIRQSVDITGIGAHAGYELQFLIDNPIPLADCQYGRLTQLGGTASEYLVDMLQRTLKYEEDDKIGDMPFAEAIAWYEADRLLGYLTFMGTDNGTMASWGLQGIPDLSTYRIESLYALDSSAVSADRADLDIRILAEVTSVPEPSSLLLLALGVAGMCLLKRMKTGTE